MSDSSGSISLFKAQTVLPAPEQGVLDALELASTKLGLSVREFLGATSALLHGSTVATNSVLTGSTAKTGLIINRGYEDLLLIGLGSKGKASEDMFRSHMTFPEPFIPRYLTVGIGGRINAEGGVETHLDEAAVRIALKDLNRYSVEAIAVSKLWSPINNEHERRVAEIVNEELPGIPVSLGSEVNPLIREYERTSATAIDVSLKPKFSRYVLELEKRLKELGYKGDLLMINSSGGVMKAVELAESPIYAIKSGPSVGPSAGLALSDREGLGRNVLVCDMGGTSFDVSLVTDGRIIATTDNKVGPYHYNISCVEVNSIGAGGGSIAFVDPGGLLQVGPASAGSSPGPACYGLGGEEPTVTDANVLLGYLSPDYFLGGTIAIDPELSKKAVKDKLCGPLEMDTVAAASLVFTAVNQSMVKGLEEVSIRRGIDPREYLLVAGGGACAMHAVPIAEELAISRILIPRLAAGLCAYGTLFGDVIFQRSKGVITRSDEFDFEQVNSAMESLEIEGYAFLERANISPEMRSVEFTISARYPYQAWEIEFPVPWKRIGRDQLSELIELFHAAHDERHGFRVEHVMECVNVTAKASGRRSEVNMADSAPVRAEGEQIIKGVRLAYSLDDRRFVNHTVYSGEALSPGISLEGPAIIEEPQTTIVVPGGYQVSVTKLGNYLLEPSI